MEIRDTYQLAPLVCYDDYDGCGYLLDIRHGVLKELSEQDTCMLSAVLHSISRAEAIRSLSLQIGDDNLELEVSALLQQLERQGWLSLPAADQASEAPRARAICNETVHAFHAITLRQRIAGAGHIIFVLNELRKVGDGLYRAYQYIHSLKSTTNTLSTEEALRAVREEYWFYRIITGLFERRIARLLGQVPGEEGLCMVRAFALCAYLLVLDIPAQIIIARPKYGSRSGFKLHVWVELNGKPLNEVANIRDRYRVLCTFPSYS